MKFTRLGGIVFSVLLQAVLISYAHSHSSQFQDSDYFVRPETTTGLIYSGRHYYPKHLGSWKWINLSEDHSVRYRGKVIIYRYHCPEYLQHRRSTSGSRRLTLAQSWRIDTPTVYLRPLCSCYKCIARPRLKKLIVQSGCLQYIYVIYYSGEAEIHKDEKPEHRVKPKAKAKPKPKPKMKPLEQHSRKRSRQFEPRNRKKEHRRPPRCGVSSHTP